MAESGVPLLGKVTLTLLTSTYFSRGEDKEGYRAEFTRLVLTADMLQSDGQR